MLHKRRILPVLLFMCFFATNVHAGIFWIGETTQSIESDTSFYKLLDHIDDFGFRVRVFARQGSDYIYSFSFNDQEKVIATKIQVIDEIKVKGNPKTLQDITIKQPSYAKFLEIKTSVRDYLKGQMIIQGRNPADLSVTSERDYQWVDFKSGSTLILTLGVFEHHLSIITPESTSVATVGLEKILDKYFDPKKKH